MVRGCELCGKKNQKKKGRSVIERHHIEYEPEIILDLCRSCHAMISNYERNPSVYDTDSIRFKAIKVYLVLKEKKIREAHGIVNNGVLPSKGRNSQVIGFRISTKAYLVMLGEAKKKNVSVGIYLKERIEDWVERELNIKAKAPAEHSQRVYPIKLPLSLYNPAVHKAGDRVLVKVGGRLKEAVVPELDGDGHLIPW